jgi:cytochrome c553
MKSSIKVILAATAALAIPSLVGAADAAENWKKSCAMCHAADGSGSGTMGKKLGLKDYTDPAVQAAMTDEEIIKVTKEGAKDAAGKQVMKPYADKLTDEDIAALVTYIRAFKKDS